MKISYAIPVCNEITEIQRLLGFLIENKRVEDEIIVLYDVKNGTIEVEEYLREASSEGEFTWHKYAFDGHFADMKNELTSLCNGDYIYQIDADEIISDEILQYLPSILETNDIDVLRVPRINTVKGLTQEHIQKWGWRVDDKGWVNFPDYQWRIYRNNDKIKWKNKVHEVLEGHNTFGELPSDVIFCLIHEKTIERQEKQNEYYNTLEEGKKILEKKRNVKYYLYGLQRSGTNVIQTFIEKNFNVLLTNKNEQNRQSPHHKHFRIYGGKEIIPQTNSINQYKNKYIDNSLKDLDELLGDLNQTNKYIIVYKNIFSWLPSIEKWAKACNWKTNSKMEFVEDYLNFIKKWYSIKNDRVLFINYEDFLNISNNDPLLDKLSVFFNAKPKEIISTFQKVDNSEEFTNLQKIYYVNHEYMDLYSKEELSKIRNNLIYKELVNYNL